MCLRIYSPARHDKTDFSQSCDCAAVDGALLGFEPEATSLNPTRAMMETRPISPSLASLAPFQRVADLIPDRGSTFVLICEEFLQNSGPTLFHIIQPNAPGPACVRLSESQQHRCSFCSALL